MKKAWIFVALGVVFLLAGSYIGLFVAPAEQYMGQVQRIMYVHVPTAWNWMLAVLFAFSCSIAFLFTAKTKWDARMEAGLEVATLFAFLLCCQGAIWAKKPGFANTSSKCRARRLGSFLKKVAASSALSLLIPPSSWL